MTRPGLAGHLADFLEVQGLAGTVGVVAVSGGADSVALASAAVDLLRRGKLAGLHLAHFNHLLRGPESDADEAFVRDLAKAWSVPLESGRCDVADIASRQGRNLEAAARDLRYGWLSDVACQHGAAWVATGHTADDQAETVLHHLLRGSGLTGLSGIAPRRPLAPGVDLIRPLLAVDRRGVLEYLASEGVAFREDSSNADPRFTRNRIRRELLPLLRREYNPALPEILNRLASQAAECQAALTLQAARCLAELERPRAGPMLVFDRPGLHALGPFWARETLRTAWQREGWPAGEMTHDDWTRLAGLAASEHSRHEFPAGIRARSIRYVLQLWREAI